MNLTEASILKKYESDIGNSISEVGGDVPYDLHWIPDTDEVVERQLIAASQINDRIDERINLKFVEMGITEETVSEWNQSYDDLRGTGQLVERVGQLEYNGDNVWDKTSFWVE